ncbi:Ycf23 family protein [Salix suchowensis]|nr:Ycf23 family protein [Salix suchowensis]
MFSSSLCMPISPSSHSLLQPNRNPLQGSKPSFSPLKRRASYFTTRALLSTSKETVLKYFHEQRALKIISGLQNFNKENVASVVTAADKGGATHVDIACDPELVKLAVSLTSLPLQTCSKSYIPFSFSLIRLEFPQLAGLCFFCGTTSFLAAVEAGAQMVEIGNYDSFYDQGVVFSPDQILNLTKETKRILPSVTLSVTVPHTLSLPDQVKLAELLEQEGVDIIQTEGGKCSNPSKAGVLGLIEKATPSLAAAYSISRAVKIPVMCSSGLSAVTAPMAITAGAAGVGVGSAINRLNDVVAMIAEVKNIADSLGSAADRHSKSEEKSMTL